MTLMSRGKSHRRDNPLLYDANWINSCLKNVRNMSNICSIAYLGLSGV